VRRLGKRVWILRPGGVGIVVKGLFYLLFTGIGVLLVAFLLGAFWMRRRNARRHPAR